jgi:hypothetical protein
MFERWLAGGGVEEGIEGTEHGDAYFQVSHQINLVMHVTSMPAG